MISVNPNDWKLLLAAQQARGMITMLLARAALPDASDQMIRRRLERLEAQKLLASGWVMPLPEHGTTPIKVWYTLRKAASGGDSGITRIRAAVRAQMAKPEDKRRKLKYGETLITPDTLFHDQISAALTIGFGKCGTRFDSSFDRNAIPGMLKIPDGIATLENGIQLLIEAERMLRKTEHEWKRDHLTGLPCSIHSAGQSKSYKYEHVIVVPGNLFDGLYRVVSRCKRERERGGAKGYWRLPWEEPTADLEWVSLCGEAREPMAGLARMRVESPVRARNVRLLRERREAKAGRAVKGQNICPPNKEPPSGRFSRIGPQSTISAVAHRAQRLPEPGSREAKEALQKLIDDMKQQPVAAAPKFQKPAYAPGSAEAKQALADMIKNLRQSAKNSALGE